MLTLAQMVTRLVVAIALGMLMGYERERLGKEAGLRTAMLVSAGASIFSMISIMIPYFARVNDSITAFPDAGRVISNIVVGIGFLGAGIIIQKGEHVRGLTTAALIWTVAAIGTLVGLGLIQFAFIAAIVISGILYLSRRLDIRERIRHSTENQRKDI